VLQLPLDASIGVIASLDLSLHGSMRSCAGARRYGRSRGDQEAAEAGKRASTRTGGRRPPYSVDFPFKTATSFFTAQASACINGSTVQANGV
jgi:hypothetical protein